MSNNTELAQTFAQRINELHKANTEKASGLRFTTIALLNDIRAEGVLLEDAKNTLGHNGWRDLQEQLDFGPQREQVVQTYLNFARKNKVEITNVEEGMRALGDALMVTGMLPFPEGHGPQRLHPPNLFSWCSKQCMSFRAELKKKLAQTPLESFSPSAREQFVETIKPVRDELNAMIAMAETI